LKQQEIRQANDTVDIN